ncbi:MAG: glycosyl hydrolase, partial [Cyclobacteriaceae bacterium]
MKVILFYALLCLIGLQSVSAQQPVSPLVDSYKEHLLKKEKTPYNLEWIQLGPTINGARVESVQVDTKKPGTMYVAFGSGNLWKTTNNGMTWKAIFENQPTLGIGDIALAPSNSDIIY